MICYTQKQSASLNFRLLAHGAGPLRGPAVSFEALTLCMASCGRRDKKHTMLKRLRRRLQPNQRSSSCYEFDESEPGAAIIKHPVSSPDLLPPRQFIWRATKQQIFKLSQATRTRLRSTSFPSLSPFTLARGTSDKLTFVVWSARLCGLPPFLLADLSIKKICLFFPLFLFLVNLGERPKPVMLENVQEMGDGIQAYPSFQTDVNDLEYKDLMMSLSKGGFTLKVGILLPIRS